MNSQSKDLPGKILIVDDEEYVRDVIKETLERENFESVTASTAEEGLEILKTSGYNFVIILSDLKMPGLSGMDFLEQVKKLLPDSIRIILTGYGDKDTAIDAVNRAEAHRYMAKPWNSKELLHIITEAFHKHNLIKENIRLTELTEKQNEQLKNWNKKLSKLVEEQIIEKITNIELLKKDFNLMVINFVELFETRYKSIINHGKYVSEIAEKIAIKKGLSPEEIENIRLAALLHDIGKVTFPDLLLEKEFESLSIKEIKEYIIHPVRGQTTIDSINSMRDIGILIRHHHENFNGTGYPDKLNGEKIPLGSRIIAIANFLEKVTSKYNGEEPIKYVMAKFKKKLSTKFDPELYQFAENTLTEFCQKFSPVNQGIEKEVHISNLQENMILSRNLITGSGLLFLVKGTLLNEQHINSIKRYHYIDPSKPDIFVWTDKKLKDEKQIPLGNETILITGQNQGFLNFMEKNLTELGYKITRITDSITSLKEFCMNPKKYKLIITEQNMTKLNGIELAEHILEVRSDMPIILYINSNIDDTANYSEKFRAILIEPVELFNMAEIIRQVLDEI